MRVGFPRFLNNNRLLYKLEYDEWIVLAFSFFLVFYLLGFFLMIHPILAFAMAYYITKRIFKFYREVLKTASPGYLYHFLYNYGFAKPKEDKQENSKGIKFPYGYETEFKN